MEEARWQAYSLPLPSPSPPLPFPSPSLLSLSLSLSSPLLSFPSPSLPLILCTECHNGPNESRDSSAVQGNRAKSTLWNHAPTYNFRFRLPRDFRVRCAGCPTYNFCFWSERHAGHFHVWRFRVRTARCVPCVWGHVATWRGISFWWRVSFWCDFCSGVRIWKSDPGSTDFHLRQTRRGDFRFWHPLCDPTWHCFWVTGTRRYNFHFRSRVNTKFLIW